jgi:hypothetical protein
MRKTIQSVCGIAVFGAVAFSWLFSLSFWNRLTLWHDRDQYKPATFVVTGAVFERGGQESLDEFDYWLDGTVAGAPERLIPERERVPAPRNPGELELRYPKGSKISVFYNPAATTTIVQNETLRVIEATPGFWDREAARRRSLGLLVLGPAPLALSVYLSIRYINRRHQANVRRQNPLDSATFS